MKLMEKLYFKGTWLKNKTVEAWQDEEGMGVIEIAIIIIVLIAIALLFRENIIELVETLMEKMFVPEDGMKVELNG